MSEPAEKFSAHLEEQTEIGISASRFETARSWLKEFRKHEGLEKIGVARRLGFGDDGRKRVHDFLEGNDDPAMVLAVERLRASVEGPDGISKFIGFRETRCARTIIDFALKIRAAGMFGAIVGQVGAGKTEALKRFQRGTRDDGRPPVRVIRACSVMNANGLVRSLAEEMGIKTAEINKLYREIVRMLSARPEFLVIDEADYLLSKDRCLHLFRDLHDETGVGILFSGQLDFLSQVWARGNRAAASNREEGRLAMGGTLAAFADRLRVQVAPGLDDEEVVSISQEVLKMTLTDEAAKRLIVFVNHDFRVLSLMIGAMRELRTRAGKTVDHRFIEAAWSRAMHIKSRQ